jgi:hypothetical protein
VVHQQGLGHLCTALNTGRESGSSGANHSAALHFGGNPASKANTESYNGTSWTEVNDLNTGRGYVGGQGTQTAALCFAGNYPGVPFAALSETWDGTNWSEGNDLNTARYTVGNGTLAYTASICVGGLKSPATVAGEVELYDGTSWTEATEMNTARNGPFVSGDSANAISAGGSVEPGVQAVTESMEWF